MGPDDSESFEQTGNTVADETPEEVTAPDPSELVQYYHPSLDGKRSAVALTTREAFERLWGPKGWKLVEDDDSPEAAEAGAVLVDQPNAVLEGLTLTGQSVTGKPGQQDVSKTPSDPGATK